MSRKPYTIGMVSLGCPKNQVDAEQMLGVLAGQGFALTPDPAAADVIVVNTCGFIESAKEESIEAIVEAGRMKREGRCRALIVAGCLAQRYREELAQELPEADAVIGTAEIPKVAGIVERLLGGRERVIAVGAPALVAGLRRISTTPRHYRHLKIAEGCSNRCSYCAIPVIRGGFLSRPSGSVIDEAKRLADEGARELILLAQDSTQYRDRDLDLPRLLARLAKVAGPSWIRLMYVHPARVTDALMGVLAGEEKLCRYLDLPVQHIDAGVLKAMNRPGGPDDIKRTIDALRRRVPGISLRTSLIVGFPGETEAAFRRLQAFVREHAFEHLGVFTWSPEEGTPAAGFPGRVPKEIARERQDKIMAAQAKVSLAKNRSLVGKRVRVLVDGLEDLTLLGRTEGQAPEIDGVVYLSGIEAAPGEFVEAVITDAREYDIVGEGVLPGQ